MELSLTRVNWYSYSAHYISTVRLSIHLLFRLAMLRKWRSKYGPTATYRELANCFYRADMQSMVQEICQLLGDRGK